MDVDGAGGKLELNDIIRQIQKRDSGAVVQANRRGTNVQFDETLAIGHMRSPMVTGRFNSAATQSLSPPPEGWKETLPCTRLMRATRPGGSSCAEADLGVRKGCDGSHGHHTEQGLTCFHSGLASSGATSPLTIH